MKLKSALMVLALLTSAHAFGIQFPNTDKPILPPFNEIEDRGDEQDVEEFDPSAPDAEEILKAYDEYYEQMTGESPFLEGYEDLYTPAGSGCKRASCAVWIRVSKAKQRAYLTLHGSLVDSWPVSTARKGYGTKNWDYHPNGRVYSYYESTRFPGGSFNYKGRRMGNMGFAVFYSGGFALHGTAATGKLGRPASHGCVRQHPAKAAYFNSLVRQYGVRNTWITVQ